MRSSKSRRGQAPPLGHRPSEGPVTTVAELWCWYPSSASTACREPLSADLAQVRLLPAAGVQPTRPRRIIVLLPTLPSTRAPRCGPATLRPVAEPVAALEPLDDDTATGRGSDRIPISPIEDEPGRGRGQRTTSLPPKPSQSFADFAEKLGAHTCDLLEAAAVYLHAGAWAEGGIHPPRLVPRN